MARLFEHQLLASGLCLPDWDLFMQEIWQACELSCCHCSMCRGRQVYAMHLKNGSLCRDSRIGFITMRCGTVTTTWVRLVWILLKVANVLQWNIVNYWIVVIEMGGNNWKSNCFPAFQHLADCFVYVKIHWCSIASVTNGIDMCVNHKSVYVDPKRLNLINACWRCTVTNTVLAVVEVRSWGAVPSDITSDILWV